MLSSDDILNEYVRQISVDLFLLAFDVSALDPQPLNVVRSSATPRTGAGRPLSA